MRRVEWIGVKSPKDDEMIRFRMSAGLYTPDQERSIRLSDSLTKPLIRVWGTTIRRKGPRSAAGYSKHYEWGPRHFVCKMEDIDADRMFSMDPDEHEFRDLDNPDHDDRVPIVPWKFITQRLYDIMREAENGPQLVRVGGTSASNIQQVGKALEQITKSLQEKQEVRDWKNAKNAR